MSSKYCAIIAVVVCTMVVPVQAAPLVVDGNLSDWGVTVADNNGSVYGLASDIGLLGFMVEDQNDSAGDSGYLGPNHGGQNYDAEMIAVAYLDSRIYVSIVTGQRPDNGFQRYAPGDIYIETADAVYGIEIGGGEGGGPGSAVVTGDSGSTYSLSGNGYTQAHTVAPVAQTAGSIWCGPTWVYDPINPYSPTQVDTSLAGSLVGVAEFIYTRDTSTAQHAVIELAFDFDILGGENIETIRWTPSCGNDEVIVNPSPVPEPSTLSLLAASFLFFVRRR